MRVALVSLNQVWESKKDNIELCKNYIEQATKSKAEYIFFPELTLTGFTMSVNELAENHANSETLKQFQKMSTSYGIDIIAGCIIEENNSYFNRAIYFSSKEEEQTHYSKIHPFSFSGEEKYFSKGCDVVIKKNLNLSLGLSICYDLRFPELYQALSRDANVIVNIANWPEKRIEHWNTLLKARAIENQIFMIGVNRVGIDGNGISYAESSQIYNPNGDKLNPCQQSDNMFIYDISLNDVKKYRDNFPVKNDRQVDFYKSIL